MGNYKTSCFTKTLLATRFILSLTFLVLGYLDAARMTCDPVVDTTVGSDPVNCLFSPELSIFPASGRVTELLLPPSSKAACESSACCAMACFWRFSLWAELVRYREIRLFGRGLDGLAGGGLGIGFSAATSCNNIRSNFTRNFSFLLQPESPRLASSLQSSGLRFPIDGIRQDTSHPASEISYLFIYLFKAI